MGRVEGFLGRVTTDEDWCPGVETTLEASSFGEMEQPQAAGVWAWPLS